MLARYLDREIVSRLHFPENINNFLEKNPQISSGYTIASVLGSGGYGTVFRLQKPENPDFALKIGASPEEIKIHSLLSKARMDVPEVFFTEDSTIVMSLSNSGDFTKASFLDQRLCPAFFGKQVLCILRPIHKIGVLHGDIYSANLLVSNLGTPQEKFVLADWGLAKRLENGQVRPPVDKNEPLRGNPCVSHRVEVPGASPAKIDDFYGIFFAMASMDAQAMASLDRIAEESFDKTFFELQHSELRFVKLKLLFSELESLPEYLKEFAQRLLASSGSDEEYDSLWSDLLDILIKEYSWRATLLELAEKVPSPAVTCEANTEFTPGKFGEIGAYSEEERVFLSFRSRASAGFHDRFSGQARRRPRSRDCMLNLAEALRSESDENRNSLPQGGGLGSRKRRLDTEEPENPKRSKQLGASAFGKRKLETAENSTKGKRRKCQSAAQILVEMACEFYNSLKRSVFGTAPTWFQDINGVPFEPTLRDYVFHSYLSRKHELNNVIGKNMSGVYMVDPMSQLMRLLG